MKFIVTSDSHGEFMAMRDIILKHNNADVIIFCGDGSKDIDEIRYTFPEKMVISVRGNCDWYCDNPDVQEITLCGRKIFITHGHIFGVKQGYQRIIQRGQSINADIVLFGHTHQQFSSFEGNMLLLNPGSIGHKQYSTIEIDENSGKIKVTEYPYNKSFEINF